MSSISYPNLFKSGRIGKLDIKNRIVMLPIDSVFRTEGGASNEQHRYYLGARAAGGVGLIITDNFTVEYPRGAVGSKAGRIDQDRFIASLNETIEEIHSWDTSVFVQICHAGRQTTLGGSQGQQLISASAISWEESGTIPKELTTSEIKDIVKKFTDAAERVKMACADGVEVHACNGYLLSSFLSPALNHRNDEYGGSIYNRARIVVQIIKSIKEEVGDDYPLSVRINCRDGIPGGLEVLEAAEFAKIFEEAGADVIDISAGTYESPCLTFPPMMESDGFLLSDINIIKQAVNIPVIAVGKIKKPSLAEKIIAEGQADFIGLGRPLLADPEWPNKVKKGMEEYIRPCIGCNKGCIKRIDLELSLKCNVNPYLGKEKLLMKSDRIRAKKLDIVVVGAGPAGLEFALLAQDKGHRVRIFDGASRIGGQLVFAQIPDFKKELGSLINYYEKQLKKKNIDIKLNKYVTPEFIEELNPEVLVIATGAKPYIPFKLPSGGRIITHEDVLRKKVIVDGSALVVGGGSTGCEVAIYLAQLGLRVSIIEQDSELARDETPTFSVFFGEKLNQYNVAVYTSTRIYSIEKDKVSAVRLNDGSEIDIPYENLIMATGVIPNREFFEKIKNKEREIYLLGDCFKIGTILEATERACFLVERVL